MGIFPSLPSPLACLLSGLYNGTACLAKPCFTQENRPHIGAWSNRRPALSQHSASFSQPDSLFMHHGFICFNEKPRGKLQVFVVFFFFPGDRFIECIQIFTLETRPVAKTCGGKKIDCPDLTQLSSEEVCGQHTPTCSVKWQDEDKREGRGWLYSVEHHT